jgi:RimJ/RimL family protein N-acetyltransferase
VPSGVVEARNHRLAGARTLLIREAQPQDAAALLAYIECVSAETDFLTFGAGEFELTEAAEAEQLSKFAAADNQIYLLGLIEEVIVAALMFSAGTRPRMRHSGSLGMSVRGQYWGLGVGSLLLDALIDWARASGIVTKLNLCVRTDNERAISLYRRKGFVLEGTHRKELVVRGVYYDTHWFGLEL